MADVFCRFALLWRPIVLRCTCFLFLPLLAVPCDGWLYRRGLAYCSMSYSGVITASGRGGPRVLAVAGSSGHFQAHLVPRLSGVGVRWLISVRRAASGALSPRATWHTSLS